MNPIVLGSSIASAGNTVGNVASTILTNRANMKLAQYGYEQERQMIAEQNAYNSPVEQMKRYQDAGLNPNLIYGNGASSAGNQQAIAHYNAPSLDAPQIDFNNLIPALLNARKELVAIENMREQNQNLAASRDLLEQQAKGAYQDYMSKMMDNVFKSEVLGYNPGVLLTPEDSAKIREGNMFKKYIADTNVVLAEEDLKKAQTAFQKMSTQEKTYFVNNIQPLVKEYQQLQNDVLTAEKTQAEADADFTKKLEKIGLSNQGVSTVLGFLRMLVPSRSITYRR